MHRLALAAATLALAGCGTAPAPVGEAPVRAGSAGVTVELPPGWHSTDGVDGNVIDPLTRVVVASSWIRGAASACQTSSYAIADDAVALVLVEWWGPADVPGSPPQRPARFTPALLAIARGVHECYPGRGGALQFSVGDREFGAYVFLGDNAPDVLVDEVCAVLDSLVVTPAWART